MHDDFGAKCGRSLDTGRRGRSSCRGSARPRPGGRRRAGQGPGGQRGNRLHDPCPRADGPESPGGADRLAADGISAEVVDIGSLVPLDTETILGSVEKTSRLFTVEENPSLCGWGAEITSIVSKETFWYLDGPIVRIATPHIPLPAADALEDMAIPSADRIYETVARMD